MTVWMTTREGRSRASPPGRRLRNSVTETRERHPSRQDSCTQHVRAFDWVWSSTAPGVMKSLGGDTERTARLNVRVMETLFALVGLVMGEDLRIRSSSPMKRSLRWASKRRSLRGPSSSALSGS